MKHMYCTTNTQWAGRTLTITDERTHFGTEQVYATFDSAPAGITERTHWITKAECLPIPEVGDKVRATTVNGVEGYSGAVCTVSHVEYDSHDRKPLIRGEFTSIQKPDDTISFSFFEWEPIETLADVMQPDAAALQAEVDRLKGEVERLTTSRDSWMQRANDFEHDCGVWNEEIMGEAEDRDWCSDFERFLDNRIRGKLRRWEIQDREQEYEVEVEVTGSHTTTTTVTVTARSQEDADEIVSNNLSDYVDGDDVLTDAVRNESWDSIEMEVN